MPALPGSSVKLEAGQHTQALEAVRSCQQASYRSALWFSQSLRSDSRWMFAAQLCIVLQLALSDCFTMMPLADGSESDLAGLHASHGTGGGRLSTC